MTTEVVPSISIENLLNQRNGALEVFLRAQELLRKVEGILSSAGARGVCDYFSDRYSRHSPPKFTSDEAVTHFKTSMDADLWQKLMRESGLRTFMDAATRQKWDKSISNGEVVELNRENIVSTFESLYGARGEMFENGVISIFKCLSWSYKSNCPSMFNKRLIMNNVLDRLEFPNLSAANSFDDLMRVFTIVDGKPEPDVRNGFYSQIIKAIREEKNSIQGEYFDLKWFKSTRTGHVIFKRLDLVVYLNRILAKHFPNAISSDIRPTKSKTSFSVKEKIHPRIVNEGVCAVLSDANIFALDDSCFGVALPNVSRSLYEEVNEVLMAIGGQWQRGKKAHVFEENPTEVIANILRDRVYLDPKDYGFFETPNAKAEEVVIFAELESGMKILEPSAGRAAIANACTPYVDKHLIELVEFMPANAAALRKGGWHVTEADFLDLEPEERFCRVLMNPPFSSQQDILHVNHAWKIVRPGGRLVAIMSAGVMFNSNTLAKEFRSFIQLHGGRILENGVGAFKESGTNVNTITLIIDKAPRLL